MNSSGRKIQFAVCEIDDLLGDGGAVLSIATLNFRKMGADLGETATDKGRAAQSCVYTKLECASVIVHDVVADAALERGE